MNISEEYDLALKVMRLEREFAAEKGNQAPESPSAPLPPDSKMRTPEEATARGLAWFQKIVDAVYGVNQDPLNLCASPREFFDKIRDAVYNSRRD